MNTQQTKENKATTVRWQAIRTPGTPEHADGQRRLAESIFGKPEPAQGKKKADTLDERCPNCGVEWRQHSWSTFDECREPRQGKAQKDESPTATQAEVQACRKRVQAQGKAQHSPLPDLIVQGKIDGALVDQNGIYVSPSQVMATLRKIANQRDEARTHADKLAEALELARTRMSDAGMAIPGSIHAALAAYEAAQS